MGTDVHVLTVGPDGRGVQVPHYVPNLQARRRSSGLCFAVSSSALTSRPQVEAKDAFLGGDIRVHSKEQELSYTKRFDVNGATVARRATLRGAHARMQVSRWACRACTTLRPERANQPPRWRQRASYLVLIS